MNCALRLISFLARLSGASIAMYVLMCIYICIKHVGFQELLFATDESASCRGCDFQKQIRDCGVDIIAEERRPSCKSASCDLKVFLKPRFGLQMTFRRAYDESGRIDSAVTMLAFQINETLAKQHQVEHPTSNVRHSGQPSSSREGP